MACGRLLQVSFYFVSRKLSRVRVLNDDNVLIELRMRREKKKRTFKRGIYLKINIYILALIYDETKKMKSN